MSQSESDMLLYDVLVHSLEWEVTYVRPIPKAETPPPAVPASLAGAASGVFHSLVRSVRDISTAWISKLTVGEQSPSSSWDDPSRWCLSSSDKNEVVAVLQDFGTEGGVLQVRFQSSNFNHETSSVLTMPFDPSARLSSTLSATASSSAKNLLAVSPNGAWVIAVVPTAWQVPLGVDQPSPISRFQDSSMTVQVLLFEVVSGHGQSSPTSEDSRAGHSQGVLMLRQRLTHLPATPPVRAVADYDPAVALQKSTLDGLTKEASSVPAAIGLTRSIHAGDLVDVVFIPGTLGLPSTSQQSSRPSVPELTCMLVDVWGAVHVLPMPSSIASTSELGRTQSIASVGAKLLADSGCDASPIASFHVGLRHAVLPNQTAAVATSPTPVVATKPGETTSASSTSMHTLSGSVLQAIQPGGLASPASARVVKAVTHAKTCRIVLVVSPVRTIADTSLPSPTAEGSQNSPSTPSSAALGSIRPASFPSGGNGEVSLMSISEDGDRLAVIWIGHPAVHIYSIVSSKRSTGQAGSAKVRNRKAQPDPSDSGWEAEPPGSLWGAFAVGPVAWASGGSVIVLPVLEERSTVSTALEGNSDVSVRLVTKFDPSIRLALSSRLDSPDLDKSISRLHKVGLGGGTGGGGGGGGVTTSSSCEQDVYALSFWDSDSLIVSRRNGRLTINNIATATNLLGLNPEQFRGPTAITPAVNGSFACLECEPRPPACLLPGGKVRPPVPANTSLLQIYRFIMFNYTSPDRLYRLRIEQRDYDAALAIAHRYGLDEDHVWKSKWLVSAVTETSIRTILFRIADPLFKLEQCVEAVPQSVATQKILLDRGLKLTTSLMNAGEHQSYSLNDVRAFRLVLTLLSARLSTFVQLCHLASDDVASGSDMLQPPPLPFVPRLSNGSDSAYDALCRRYTRARSTGVEPPHERPIQEPILPPPRPGMTAETVLGGWPAFHSATLVDYCRVRLCYAKRLDLATVLVHHHAAELVPWIFHLLDVTGTPPSTPPAQYLQLFAITDEPTGTVCSVPVKQWHGQVHEPEPLLKDPVVCAIAAARWPSLAHHLVSNISDDALYCDDAPVPYPADVQDDRIVIPSDKLAAWMCKRAADIDRATGRVDLALGLLEAGLGAGMEQVDCMFREMRYLAMIVYREPSPSDPRQRYSTPHSLLHCYHLLSWKHYCSLDPFQRFLRLMACTTATTLPTDAATRAAPFIAEYPDIPLHGPRSLVWRWAEHLASQPEESPSASAVTDYSDNRIGEPTSSPTSSENGSDAHMAYAGSTGALGTIRALLRESDLVGGPEQAVFLALRCIYLCTATSSEGLATIMSVVQSAANIARASTDPDTLTQVAEVQNYVAGADILGTYGIPCTMNYVRRLHVDEHQAGIVIQKVLSTGIKAVGDDRIFSRILADLRLLRRTVLIDYPWDRVVIAYCYALLISERFTLATAHLLRAVEQQKVVNTPDISPVDLVESPAVEATPDDGPEGLAPNRWVSNVFKGITKTVRTLGLDQLQAAGMQVLAHAREGAEGYTGYQHSQDSTQTVEDPMVVVALVVSAVRYFINSAMTCGDTVIATADTCLTVMLEHLRVREVGLDTLMVPLDPSIYVDLNPSRTTSTSDSSGAAGAMVAAGELIQFESQLLELLKAIAGTFEMMMVPIQIRMAILDNDPMLIIKDIVRANPTAFRHLDVMDSIIAILAEIAQITSTVAAECVAPSSTAATAKPGLDRSSLRVSALLLLAPQALDAGEEKRSMSMARELIAMPQRAFPSSTQVDICQHRTSDNDSDDGEHVCRECNPTIQWIERLYRSTLSANDRSLLIGFGLSTRCSSAIAAVELLDTVWSLHGPALATTGSGVEDF